MDDEIRTNGMKEKIDELTRGHGNFLFIIYPENDTLITTDCAKDMNKNQELRGNWGGPRKR